MVGCNGTRSAVHHAADIDLLSQDTTLSGWLADVELDNPPVAPLAATPGRPVRLGAGRGRRGG
ncbi:hypothetical protein [Streptomyces ehimensis]|uniref:Uncharacterized protein n=1 Tax=Streptomyces ehimensis TaxID=68195 RepID=A0ABV9BU84_9ACTN